MNWIFKQIPYPSSPVSGIKWLTASWPEIRRNFWLDRQETIPITRYPQIWLGPGDILTAFHFSFLHFHLVLFGRWEQKSRHSASPHQIISAEYESSHDDEEHEDSGQTCGCRDVKSAQDCLQLTPIDAGCCTDYLFLRVTTAGPSVNSLCMFLADPLCFLTTHLMSLTASLHVNTPGNELRWSSFTSRSDQSLYSSHCKN